MEDDLRSEYDLKRLKVRRFGALRKSFGHATIHLEPDAQMFPNADAVNEANQVFDQSYAEKTTFYTYDSGGRMKAS